VRRDGLVGDHHAFSPLGHNVSPALICGFEERLKSKQTFRLPPGWRLAEAGWLGELGRSGAYSKTYVNQYLNSVHVVNIALDVHTVNAVVVTLRLRCGGLWIACWIRSATTSELFSDC
jgi:hypothetical protein